MIQLEKISETPPEVPLVTPPKLLPEGEEEIEETPEMEYDAKRIAQLEKAFANSIAFMSVMAVNAVTGGIPSDLFKQKVSEYTDLAMETGFAQSLVTIVDIYLADYEMAPWLALIAGGLGFFSVVVADIFRLKEEKAKKAADSKTIVPPEVAKERDKKFVDLKQLEK